MTSSSLLSFAVLSGSSVPPGWLLASCASESYPQPCGGVLHPSVLSAIEVPAPQFGNGATGEGRHRRALAGKTSREAGLNHQPERMPGGLPISPWRLGTLTEENVTVRQLPSAL